MKIMFLYDFPLWGSGSATYLRELTSELIKNGYQIAIVAPDKRRLDNITHFEVIPPHLGVFVGHPELKNAKKYEDMSGKQLSDIYIAYIRDVTQAVEKFKPHVIHVFHLSFIAPVARLMKIFYGIPFVITVHGSDLHYLSQDRRLVGLINDALRIAKFISCNSFFTREWFIKMFGKDYSYKTRTILGGVRPELLSKGSQKLDEKYNLNGKRVALFTGRLTSHKGVEYLVKAAKNIKGEVIILGDGPERSYLEQLIKDEEITNVHLLGYLSAKELGEFYRRADVYVAPSVWDEPLGLVILEAMAANTPVIVTKKGGITSIVKDGYNGFFVRHRNATEIAEKVNRLFENEQLRKRMGENAKKTVVERFQWENIAIKFERIYKKAARRIEPVTIRGWFTTFLERLSGRENSQ